MQKKSFLTDGIIFLVAITFTTLFLSDLYNEKNKMLQRKPAFNPSASTIKRQRPSLQQELQVHAYIYMILILGFCQREKNYR